MMVRATDYIAFAVIGAFFTLILMPLFKSLARWVKMEAFVNKRTSHTGIVPETGGLALMLFAFVMSLLDIHTHLMAWTFVVAVMGMVDDCVDLRASLKLVIEMCISAIFVWFVAREVTVYSLALWFMMLCVINAINLIDGIDGLAAGICLTALMAMTLLVGEPKMMVVVGVLAVFFIYSAFGREAKVFLGDGGSLALGFMISGWAVEIIASFQDTQLGSADVLRAIVLMLVLVPVPLLDMARVVVVRLAAHESPFRADRRHFHHFLVDHKLRHWQAALIEISINIILGIGVALLFDHFAP